MMVVGLVLIVMGVVLFAGGVVAVAGVFMAVASAGGGGPDELLQQVMPLFAGVLVLTAGRVLVRGARRRGVRDRFGRLVMLASLALLGLGFAAFVAGWEDVFAGVQDVMDGSAPIDSITEDSMVSGVVGTVLLPTAGWLLAAAVLDLIGRRLADEPKPLITVSLTADF
jgi:hypothetical protein